MKNHMTKARRAEFRESSAKLVKRVKKDDGRTAVLGAQHVLANLDLHRTVSCRATLGLGFLVHYVRHKCILQGSPKL